MLPSIGIVGTTLEGWTLALACREVGTGPVVIYQTVASPGSPLHLTPNASRVLHALGLKAALAETALQPQWSFVRNARTGSLLAQRPLGLFSESRYNAPDYLVDEQDLLKLLSAAAIREGVTLVTGNAPTELSPEEGRLRFADASETEHGAVIGCDGPGAFTARELGLAAPAAGEYRVWQGTAPVEAAPAALRSAAVNAWLGPDRFIVHFPFGDGSRIAIQLHTSTAVAAARPLPDQPDLHAFAHWRAELREMLAAVPDWVCRTVPETPVAAYWHTGRAALLGEACHPLPPHLLQNAAMGLEDAWVLSRMLERWEEAPAQGLADYVRYRRPRAERARRESLQHGHDYTLTDRRQMFTRNIKLSLGSRFLPELQMARLDWLYGYDCVRGFD